MVEDGLLDVAVMDGLRERFGADMFRALVAQFTSEMAGRVPAIEAALAAGDLAALRQQAHDITTSAGTLGVTGVSSRSAATEAACKSGDASAALAAGEALPALLREAVAQVEAQYG